jgi:hypothetical protein
MKKKGMKSPWKITSQYVDDKRMYAVYRTIDIAQVDHSGNREIYRSGYLEVRDEALAIANRLNKEEEEST